MDSMVENLEHDPPMSGRQRPSRAPRVIPGPILRKERIRQLREARDSLNTGLEVMRLVCGSFDSDGTPYFDTAVHTRAGLGRAIRHIKNAADLLFDSRHGDADAEVSQAFLDILWDSADVVICARAALQLKKLPDGYGMTACPVRGALTVAIGKLEGLVGDIGAAIRSKVASRKPAVRS